jgi:hypothetical protein
MLPAITRDIKATAVRRSAPTADLRSVLTAARNAAEILSALCAMTTTPHINERDCFGSHKAG